MHLTKAQKATIKNWKTHIKPGRWVKDRPMYMNHGTILIHQVSDEGPYIEVLKDGSMTIGTYVYAFQSITDGMFTPLLVLETSKEEATELIKKLIGE